jgi:NADH:ubiquinone oxidoreductase subunit F (NADH-binding)
MMSEATPPPESRRSAWLAVLARYPVLSGVLIGSTLLGALAGYVFLSGDWSVGRRILGGAVGGAGVGFLITATRLVG